MSERLKRKLMESVTESLAGSGAMESGNYGDRMAQARRELTRHPAIALSWFDKRVIHKAELLAVSTSHYHGTYIKRVADARLDLSKDPSLYDRLTTS